MCGEYTARAREKFANDLFATQCAGAEIIEVKPGYARCSMKIKPEHCNARGTPMGGAVFTLADFAFAVAANAGGRDTVSQAVQITFLAASRGKTLIAEANEIKSGRTACFYQVAISDELGVKIAFATVNGFAT